MYCSQQVHSPLYLMADFSAFKKKIIPYNFIESQSLCEMSWILTFLQVGIMILHHISIIINPYICHWIVFIVFSVFQKKKKRKRFLNMFLIMHLAKKAPNMSLVSSDRMHSFRLSQFCDILSL